MKGAFEVALAKSTRREEKDVQRKLKSGPCLGTTEPGDKMLVRNLSPGRGPGKSRWFWEKEVAEVLQRHENDVIYPIKTISQAEKVWTLHRNLLMSVNHIFQTVDGAPNIGPIKIKLPKIVKSVMRKEAMKRNQRGLSNLSDAPESDEEELELILKQLLQLTLKYQNKDSLKQQADQTLNKKH